MNDEHRLKFYVPEHLRGPAEQTALQMAKLAISKQQTEENTDNTNEFMPLDP